jgi:hypothetical protein
MTKDVIMRENQPNRGRGPAALRPMRAALPLALSGIFWTRKWAVIGFTRGAAWEGDDRQGNGLAVATRRVFLYPTNESVMISAS